MALTDTAIRKAKAGDKDRKLADEKGLYLLLTTSGSKLWRLKFRHNGKEKKLSLGAYPEVTLAEARSKCEQARARLREGADPSHEKQVARIRAKLGAANNFSDIADEFIKKLEKENRAAATIVKSKWLAKNLKPALGARPVAEIKPFEVLAVLRKIEAAGKLETARRALSFAGRVFRYAIQTTRAEDDPTRALVGALTAPQTKHHSAIVDPKALGALLRAIDTYIGQPATIHALRLTPHVFQRPGEVRQMEWKEVDLDASVWAIPAGRMKQRVQHHVPLSKQAVEILKEMKTLSGAGNYVFPTIRSPLRPMSENTINGALRRLGYDGDEMTAHGFRSTASSLLNESGRWNYDAIERALAHKDADAARGAYHRSAYWPERVEMAQWWSDYLDKLRDGGTVVPFEIQANA